MTAIARKAGPGPTTYPDVTTKRAMGNDWTSNNASTGLYESNERISRRLHPYQTYLFLHASTATSRLENI